MNATRPLFLTILALTLSHPAIAQAILPDPNDPCGCLGGNAFPSFSSVAGNWGYGYDSLLADLDRWRASPFVSVDSIGASVQSRTLFRVTIEDTAVATLPRTRIWIHARTHPGEVQSTHVTNQMIALLLSDNAIGRALRGRCIFNVLPLYNPDGVELGLARQNAHGIDLESNWTAVPGEPEVQALRAHFQHLMAASNPIVIALNMHSALSCKRYFVYHAEAGTSAAFAAMQQQFIGAVRAAYPTGIEPYTYYVSWTSAPATVYPESWFWFNHGANVLALTYEDMNCTAAGAYDTTANAILTGIATYLGIPTGIIAEHDNSSVPANSELEHNFPNPFNPETVLSYRVAGTGRQSLFVRLTVYDLLGREVVKLVEGMQAGGTYRVRWNAAGLPSGVYISRLEVGSQIFATKMLLSR